MSLTLDLTSEQAAIVTEAPESKILVTAGPGTGKTHLLIARISELIEQFDLNPGRDILILSFSRAAVQEIRKRKEAGDGFVRYVKAFTFDSFATRIMAEFDAEGSWVHETYDGRIKSATDLIRTNPELKEFFAEYRHIFIDEVQDLVGDRAELVKIILQRSGGGFTLLGDPAQGIYNFQLTGDERNIGSKALYDWLRKRYKPELKEFTLTVNHRAKTAAAKKALWAGPLLNKNLPNYQQIRGRLITDISDLRTLGTMQDAIHRLKIFKGNTAILCRNNGQALLISKELNSKKIPHQLRRSASDRVVPTWVASVLSGYEHTQIGKSAFLKRADRYNETFEVTPSEMWDLLKSLEGDDHSEKSLDISAVAESIRAGDIPDDLSEQIPSNLVVSTIHRAKGLEFDRVAVLEPSNDDSFDYETELAEETRILYVALTRPKSELYHLVPPPPKWMYRNSQIDRWVRRYDKLKLAEIEVQGNDIHKGDPAGAFKHPECNILETQEYIANFVKPGDPVQLKCFACSSVEVVIAFYTVYHNGRPIGTTTEKFSKILEKAMKVNWKWEIRWPTEIENLYVETVDTVAGTAGAGQRSGLGPTDLWLRVRVTGFGHLKFQ